MYLIRNKCFQNLCSRMVFYANSSEFIFRQIFFKKSFPFSLYCKPNEFSIFRFIFLCNSRYLLTLDLILNPFVNSLCQINRLKRLRSIIQQKQTSIPFQPDDVSIPSSITQMPCSPIASMCHEGQNAFSFVRVR